MSINKYLYFMDYWPIYLPVACTSAWVYSPLWTYAWVYSPLWTSAWMYWNAARTYFAYIHNGSSRSNTGNIFHCMSIFVWTVGLSLGSHVLTGNIMRYLCGDNHKTTTVKISKLIGIESLHLKWEGILFPSDFKKKYAEQRHGLLWW